MASQGHPGCQVQWQVRTYRSRVPSEIHLSLVARNFYQVRMRKLLYAAGVQLLLLTGTVSNSACAPPDPASPPVEVVSSLVPTLEISSDSCFVYDQPRTDPYHFGPLRKGEKVKWLDARDVWTRVWIPRLKISGWVKSSHACETEEKGPESIHIPAELFTRVLVTGRTANIRSEARAQARVLMVAKMDQEFWLVNEKRGWYQVWLSEFNKTGWVFGKVVSKQKQR